MNHAINLIEKIQKELKDKKGGIPVDGGVFIFWSFVVSFPAGIPEAGRPDRAELSRIAGILTFLEENGDRFVSIPDVQAMAGLSESTLRRLFRKTTGFSPLEYHKRLRIRRVCEELRHTEKNVTEIAYDMGYQDSNYMTRQFKEVTGHTPLEYRRDPLPAFIFRNQ